jgi:hypothetical protein
MLMIEPGAPSIHQLSRHRLRGEERSPDIQVHHKIEIRRRSVDERFRAVRPCIVDEYIERLRCFDCMLQGSMSVT